MDWIEIFKIIRPWHYCCAVLYSIMPRERDIDRLWFMLHVSAKTFAKSGWSWGARVQMSQQCVFGSLVLIVGFFQFFTRLWWKMETFFHIDVINWLCRGHEHIFRTTFLWTFWIFMKKILNKWTFKGWRMCKAFLQWSSFDSFWNHTHADSRCTC